MASKPHGTRYNGDLDFRLRGNDGLRTGVRLKYDRSALIASIPTLLVY